jgi:uncharacterized membrane protein YgaE (UPF0421/DUF939 family)
MIGRRVGALRASVYPLVLTAVAAGAAWFVAHDLLGHRRAFFAPIAAMIALGVAPGERARRAAELVVGVALGIAVGDLIIAGIGTGTGQLALVVLLAMAVAVLVGGGPLLVTQAGASAVLVATLAPPSSGIYLTRAVDALVGGAVGLAVLVLAPGRPLRAAQRAVGPLLAGIAGANRDVADAIEHGDEPAAQAALARAEQLHDEAVRVQPLLAQLRETATLSPLHWRVRELLERYAAAAPQIEQLTRDARGLARAAMRSAGIGAEPPALLVGSVRELAGAIGGLPGVLAGDDGASVRDRALAAARDATRSVEGRADFASGAVAAQVRSSVADLLPMLGMPRAEAVALIRKG